MSGLKIIRLNPWLRVAAPCCVSRSLEPWPLCRVTCDVSVKMWFYSSETSRKESFCASPAGRKESNLEKPIAPPEPPELVLPGSMAIGAVSLAVAKTSATLGTVPLYLNIAMLKHDQVSTVSLCGAAVCRQATAAVSPTFLVLRSSNRHSPCLC